MRQCHQRYWRGPAEALCPVQVAAIFCHGHGPAGYPSCQRTQYRWSPVCPLGSIGTETLPEDNVYKVNNDTITGFNSTWFLS